MSGKAEAAGTAASKVSAYATSGGLALFGGLTAQEWAALIGIILGIATFCVNWYYQSKRHQLAIDSLSLKRNGKNFSKNSEEDHRRT